MTVLPTSICLPWVVSLPGRSLSPANLIPIHSRSSSSNRRSAVRLGTTPTGNFPVSPLSSQPGRHLLDGTTRVFLAGLLFPLTGIITAAFLTRRLGAEDYGLLVLSTTLFAWIELTINALFSRATIKFVGKSTDWLPIGTTVIRLHLLAGIGGGLLLGLLAFPLALLFDEPVLAPYLALYALQVPISSLSQGHQIF